MTYKHHCPRLNTLWKLPQIYNQEGNTQNPRTLDQNMHNSQSSDFIPFQILLFSTHNVSFLEQNSDITELIYDRSHRLGHTNFNLLASDCLFSYDGMGLTFSTFLI